MKFVAAIKMGSTTDSSTKAACHYFPDLSATFISQIFAIEFE
jgi:hypothetical protein